MKITLQGVGNPDFNQYADIAPTETVDVINVEQAARVCSAYIAEWDLGAGNWTNPYVFNEQGEKVARITYNGRILRPGDEHFHD